LGVDLSVTSSASRGVVVEGRSPSMNDRLQQPDRRPGEPSARFEATIHPGDRNQALEGVADLDLDRVPDPEGGVRVLVTTDEAARLVERGYEVHLLRALPVAPLDRELVMDDDSVTAWLEDQVRGIERQEES
jgi:hypothetical protein